MSDGKTRRRMNEREWQCFEDGVKYERERIIKLLEFYLGETDWSNFEGDSPSVEWIRGFSAALALIKGEN